VISCAYLEAASTRRDWFAEQVGIQGVFYGYDDDPRASSPPSTDP
jgi:hypothetical protein